MIAGGIDVLSALQTYTKGESHQPPTHAGIAHSNEIGIALCKLSGGAALSIGFHRILGAMHNAIRLVTAKSRLYADSRIGESLLAQGDNLSTSLGVRYLRSNNHRCNRSSGVSQLSTSCSRRGSIFLSSSGSSGKFTGSPP
jgi:hypothetical protein